MNKAKAIALTFSKKNEDIKEKISYRDKVKYKTSTDYICAAVRSFEGNKSNNTITVTKNDIELIITNALMGFKLELLKNNINIYPSKLEKAENESLELLEENLDLVILNIEED